MSDTFDHEADAWAQWSNDPDGDFTNTKITYSKNEETIEIELEFKHQTPKAVLFLYDDTDVWVPKSQIEDWDDEYQYEKGEMIEIEVPEWLAIKKNLY